MSGATPARPTTTSRFEQALGEVRPIFAFELRGLELTEAKALFSIKPADGPGVPKAACEPVSVLLKPSSTVRPLNPVLQRTRTMGEEVANGAALIQENGAIFHHLQKNAIFGRFFCLKLKQNRYSTPYI
jgi:hypothetical protein